MDDRKRLAYLEKQLEKASAQNPHKDAVTLEMDRLEGRIAQVKYRLRSRDMMPPSES